MKLPTHRSRHSIIIACGLLLIVLGASPALAKNLFINLLAVNGAQETKEVPLKYYLPKELKPEDVIDRGPLKFDYDMDKEQYFVEGVFSLSPKESRTIKVEVRDVWRIEKEDVDLFKSQIQTNLDSIVNDDVRASAESLAASLVKRLESIYANQEKYQGDIERRIEEYRANIEEFQELKANAFSVDYLTSEAPKAEEEKETIKMILEVENPSATEGKKITAKYYLPAEIRSNLVLDSQGFDVRFDANRQQSYLTKNEEFKPGEKKKYTIILRNAWKIPKSKVDSIDERAQKSLQNILTTKEGKPFEQGATFLANKIFANIKAIRDSQAAAKEIKEVIGSYRVNLQRYQEADEALKQLERLLALVNAKKLEKLKELEKSKVKNILNKIQALRGVAALSKALFGTRPTITTTWKIVWGILAFVAFFTAVHFFTWRARSRLMGEENAAETKGEFKEVGLPEEEAKPTKT